MKGADSLRLAFDHLEAGRLAEADALCRRLLEREPGNADVLHCLGVVASQFGKRDAAVELIQQAAALQPSNPGIASSLGVALEGVGRLEDAERSYRRALEIDPRYAEAHYNLGNALRDLARLEEAERSYRQAVSLDPRHAQAYNNLGDVLVRLRRPEEAERFLQQALALAPRYAVAHMNLGVVRRTLGRPQDAERSLRQALALNPDSAQAHYELANALADLTRYQEAEQAFRRALALEPDFAMAWFDLGVTLTDLKRREDAEGAYRRALEIQPELAGARLNLGNLLRTCGRFDEALDQYRQALRDPGIHSGLIFTLDLMESVGVAEQQDERRRWHAQHAQRFAGSILPHQNPRDPERKLRIGYVSADFRRHSACYIFGPVIRRHDHEAFEVLCYSEVPREDDVTAQLRGAVHGWRKTLGISDDALAEQIRRDAIDILVDLSGHTSGNRLLVFARKPAPVQVTAWGYATGTGVKTIDYFLADAILIPAETRVHYAEQVLDLPCCLCYEPHDYLPEPGPLPSASGKPFTFGCVNRIEKISDSVIALWGRVLALVPRSRILLKEAALDAPEARERLLARLASAGIARERVLMLGRTDHPQHLRAYQQVDIGLDPFPHGGGVSTAEALWMGVPVVALKGSTPVARLSASMLAAVQLEDWIVESADDYVRVAVEAAGQLPRIAALRGGLRRRLADSAFGNAARYVKAVEAAYRVMWRRWCEKQP